MQRLTLITLITLITPSPAQPVLPVYLEDNHAGSFFFLAETLELDQPHALVLFDSHSDASAVPASDHIRTGLRRVRSLTQRSNRLFTWRSAGRIQPFNWIEPLMPAPFAEVYWVPPPGNDLAALQAEAREHLDARIDFEHRNAGSLSDRFHTTTLEAIQTDLPTVASIDLDHFMALPDAGIPAAFDRVWKQTLALPKLTAVTFSISRPWLRDGAQADLLTRLALAAALSVRNATVQFEPFAPGFPDRSELAKSLAQENRAPHYFDLDHAPDGLRTFLAAHRDRITVTHDNTRWNAFLDAVQHRYHITADNAQPSTDTVWRLDAPTTLRIASAARRTRWIHLQPAAPTANILPQLHAAKIFTPDATAITSTREVALTETPDPALAATTWAKLLDPSIHAGTVRLAAEVETPDGQWLRTPEIELRVSPPDRSPFHRAIAEQFNLPYIFGAGFLHHDGESGPETRAGNDCANFLVYAWRRTGQNLPWCNPDQIRHHLVSADPDNITKSQIDRGLVVHANTHVAAVWQDNAPTGTLDPADLVAHHLSGPPEIITLADFLADRSRPGYDLLQRPPIEPAFTITLAGDVTCHTSTPSDENPLLPLAPLFRNSDLNIANLETVITSPETSPVRRKPFNFNSPPTILTWLQEIGITTVSVANNHTLDFGQAALKNTLAAARQTNTNAAGIAPCHPTYIKTPVGTIALLAANFSPDTADQPVVTLPAMATAFADALESARRNATTTIVLPHWGDEYTGKTNPDQRHWARWFIDHGADAVVGTGPHHLQPLDFYRARPIFYSLGNLHFPGTAGPPGFHTPHTATLTLSRNGQIQTASQK